MNNEIGMVVVSSLFQGFVFANAKVTEVAIYTGLL